MTVRSVLWLGLSLALVACGDKDDDDSGGGPADSGGTTDGGTTGGDSGTTDVPGVPEVLSDCTSNDTIYLWSAAMDGDTLVV
ncbi:MAG: hypothetical protein H6742_22365, partial [Alphaproteobacteria bacterium]|nr:hypothetical protein [Alphaproteobacteria bacterium]